jgi:hypothetical protein
VHRDDVAHGSTAFRHGRSEDGDRVTPPRRDDDRRGADRKTQPPAIAIPQLERAEPGDEKRAVDACEQRQSGERARDEVAARRAAFAGDTPGLNERELRAQREPGLEAV